MSRAGVPGPAGVVVAGVGNPMRGDDGVGAAVVRRVEGSGHPLRVRVCALADPLDLLDVWDGCELSVVVDAMCSGATPGTVRVLELCPEAGGAVTTARPAGGLPSTHALGVGAVLDLARALGRAPARVVVVAVEGADFGPGTGLTPEVAAAVPEAAARVVELSLGARPCA